MNRQRILEHFRDKILSLDIKGISAEDIQIPNVFFKRKDRPLFFEIVLGESTPQDYVENGDCRLMTIDVDIVVPSGSSTARLYNIADRVRRLYSPKIPDKCGFLLSGAKFVCRSVQIIPVTRFTRFQMDYTIEGVKLSVQFKFDVYTTE